LDEFNGVDLAPSLQPDAFKQTFVSQSVLERTDSIISANRSIQKRFTPAAPETVDWDRLTFSLTPTDAMFYSRINIGEQWQPTELVPFQDILFSPAAGVVNYGQGLFEGMKAYRSSQGRIVLFRPQENAIRAQQGAERLGLTSVPADYFLEAVAQVVKANERWIPPQGKGSLYVRPILFGSGPVLGVKPAPENTFIVYASPVGPYFKGGLVAIKLVVSKENHRAVSGGTGNIKAIGNYAPGMILAQKAKHEGYAEVIYLDAQDSKYVEEVGAANFFCIKGNILYTPSLEAGTILPGITRKSVIQLARDLGYKIKEGNITEEMIMSADEAFCTGTAAVISPIGSITWGEKTVVYNNGEVGQISRQLYEKLTAIQEERETDPYNWVYII
jgi:branched-chain amino acid aminotransferase